MIRIRVLMVSLLTVFAVGAVASASASAFELEWLVCEELAGVGKEPPLKFDNHKCNTEAKPLAERKWEWKLLAAGETRKVDSKLVKNFVLTVGGKVITCEAEENEGTITGGKPGTDEITTKFHRCKTSELGCEVHSVGEPNGLITVSKTPTKLVERKTKALPEKEVLADEFKENAAKKEFVTLQFAGTCVNFTETKVKGEVAGEQGGPLANGNYTTVFPEPELKGNTLEAFSLPAKFVGEAEILLENGWAYRAS